MRQAAATGGLRTPPRRHLHPHLWHPVMPVPVLQACSCQLKWHSATRTTSTRTVSCELDRGRKGILQAGQLRAETDQEHVPRESVSSLKAFTKPGPCLLRQLHPPLIIHNEAGIFRHAHECLHRDLAHQYMQPSLKAHPVLKTETAWVCRPEAS